MSQAQFATFGTKELEARCKEWEGRVSRFLSARPALNKANVEAAIRLHMDRLGIPPMMVFWANDLQEFITRINAVPEKAYEETAKVWEDAITARVDKLVDDKTGWLAYTGKAKRLNDPITDIQNSVWKLGKDRFACKLSMQGVVGWISEAFAWATVEPFTEDNLKFVELWIPFIDAAENGLWIFQFGNHELIALEWPELRVENNRLHSMTGPAVAWPNGRWKLYYVHGIEVADYVIEEPARIKVDEIEKEANAEKRRILIDRYGTARYIQDSKAELIDEVPEIPIRDGIYTENHSVPVGLYAGKLYSKRVQGDEDIVMVRVVNTTPDPDGHKKEYWLRVPPRTRTVKEAIAWTFSVSVEEYAPEHES